MENKDYHCKVAMVTPEATPFAKSGGLADVLGALPKALGKLGVQVSIIMPAYQSVLNGGFPLEDTSNDINVSIADHSVTCRLLKLSVNDNINVYFICNDHYFNRECMYGTQQGDYPDNSERFVVFSRAALEVLRRDPPDILHAHDWQSALTVAFLKLQPEMYPELTSTKAVFTIHNLGYQGLFLPNNWSLLNLDVKWFDYHYFEFYGKINYLKGGIVFAGAVTTVSPTYAAEIKTKEQGFGLEGVFQERTDHLYGILNGVDYTIWNPEKDSLTVETYNRANLSGKAACKTDLQKQFALPEDNKMPLIGMVTRLAAQKGLDILEEAAPDLLAHNLQLVILGTGEKRFQDAMTNLQQQYPDKVRLEIGFNEAMAHKVIAGSDFLLMPSHYEPGGLTQLYALKYGTIPIVRATGGLKDTVEDFDPETDKGNGFTFSAYAAYCLVQAVENALAVYSMKDKRQILIQNAMSADFSWENSAKAYCNLYQNLMSRKA